MEVPPPNPPPQEEGSILVLARLGGRHSDPFCWAQARPFGKLRTGHSVGLTASPLRRRGLARGRGGGRQHQVLPRRARRPSRAQVQDTLSSCISDANDSAAHSFDMSATKKAALPWAKAGSLAESSEQMEEGVRYPFLDR